MDPQPLRVGLASATGCPPRGQLALGVLAPEPASDAGLTLVEYLAYVGDVLALHQNQVAGNADLETHYDDDADVLEIRLGARRPVACLVADEGRAFVVTLGPDAGAASVRFGDGVTGARPPAGLEELRATYRTGGGGAGALELGGAHLRRPFAVAAGGARWFASCVTR